MAYVIMNTSKERNGNTMKEHKIMGIGYTDLEDLRDAAEHLLEVVEEALEKEKEEKLCEWVLNMLDKADDGDIQDILVTHRGDTYVLFTDGEWFVARLNPTDTYRPDVGVAVAIAHAYGYDIPDYV
jgi:hypothetical protein